MTWKKGFDLYHTAAHMQTLDTWICCLWCAGPLWWLHKWYPSLSFPSPPETSLNPESTDHTLLSLLTATARPFSPLPPDAPAATNITSEKGGNITVSEIARLLKNETGMCVASISSVHFGYSWTMIFEEPWYTCYSSIWSVQSKIINRIPNYKQNWIKFL